MSFIIKQLSSILLLILIVNCQAIDNNSDELVELVNNGLDDIYRKTNYITQRLQETVVEVVNEGREKLFVLKENLQEIIAKNEIPDECKKDFVKNVTLLLRKVQEDLNICSAEVFQSSELYRRKIKDDINEIESEIDLRKKLSKCFAVSNIEENMCDHEEISENKRVADELVGIFKEIQENSYDIAVEVLGDVMECNKVVLKEANEKSKELKRILLNCMDDANVNK